MYNIQRNYHALYYFAFHSFTAKRITTYHTPSQILMEYNVMSFYTECSSNSRKYEKHKTPSGIGVSSHTAAQESIPRQVGYHMSTIPLIQSSKKNFKKIDQLFEVYYCSTAPC